MRIQHENQIEPDRKTLYLLSKNTHQIRTDTSRIIVETQDQAPRQFPFNRINRIISGPNTNWQGRAIAACIQHHINILWLNQRHQPVGETHPIQRQPSPLHHSIERFIQRPDWEECYQNWLKSRKMDIINRIQLLKNHTQKEIEELKRRTVYKTQKEPENHTIINAFFQSIVSQHLSKNHSRTSYWCPAGKILEIAHDLTELLAQEYRIKNPKYTGEIKNEIENLEEYWKTEINQLTKHTESLHQHLNTESDTWP